jgi:uncharacterized protein (TIGR02466 family)|tara:strand:+ start:2244 stop:2891 length:648 start_codon:yes stop_codon:yes gene_type:complete
MSELHILFPTPVYQNFLEFRPSELKSMIDYVSNLDWASDKDIYEGPNGETTKLEADLLSEPELENLRKKIDEEVYNFAKSLQIDFSKHGLKRINSWGNLQKKGNYIKEHRHNNTQFSGVFYLQTPENSGDIIFTTRNATWINSYWEPSLTGYDDLNSFEKRFRPQQCGIFLFPAHLDHYVTPSHSEEERYSISFNYNLDGKFFGDCNNHLTLKVL